MPSPRPLRADAQRNREALLGAARQAFLAGEADIQVEEIARRAGVSVGTFYRHFDTREAVVEEVYRQDVDTMCAMPDALLRDHPPERALWEFLTLLVEHATLSKSMAATLECIMATDSPVFDRARRQMSEALDLLLTSGVAAGTIRAGATGRTVLRALGGVCGMHATDGWQDDAIQIIRLIFDGLRHVPHPTTAAKIEISSDQRRPATMHRN